MESALPTIVIVDDSAEVRSLIKVRLRLSGLLDVVAEGADGVEAIGLAYRHQPSLLLLDMSMPSMDGLDTLPGVLAIAPDTQVVIYSGFEERDLAERALELGAAAFIEKSISIDTLADRLIAVLPPGAAPSRPATGSRRQLSVVGDEPVPVEGRRGFVRDQALLDEHLERFREVFDEATIGMATMTLTGTIVRANRALGALMMCEHQDLVGVDYGMLTSRSGDLLDSALADINERSVDLVQFEHDVSGWDEPRRALAILAPVRDPKGQALYVFLQVQDITAQSKAEDQFRRSEERFRLLVEAVEDYAIFMLDPQGHVVSWNAGARRIKGYRSDEILGQRFNIFYDGEQQQARDPERELELALRDGHYAEEGWRVRKDGSRFWARVLITAVFDPAGNHVGFAKITRDQTADREAIAALRRSEERFRLLVESVGDYAIFMLDPQGHVVSWNTGAQRIKGYSGQEIIGQHFRVFYRPEQQTEGHPEHELELALRDGSYEEEGWRVRKDGTQFWANVVITAVFDETGRHFGFAKVTRDMSERRRTEQDRADSAAALAAANTSLEVSNTQLQQTATDQAQFLAMAAHELRMPSAVLGGSADTLSNHWSVLTADERTGLLGGIAASAGRLQRLLSDLLTVPRLEADSLSIQTEATSLSGVIAQAENTVRSANPPAEFLIASGPDVEVLADPMRFAQALENLLDNAVRHGSPPVRVTVGTTDRMATIRVTDSGQGVVSGIEPRLFQLFATGNDEEGTGLGLFIAREFARAQGGDVYYEPNSEEQRAGAFVLSIPLA